MTFSAGQITTIREASISALQLLLGLGQSLARGSLEETDILKKEELLRRVWEVHEKAEYIARFLERYFSIEQHCLVVKSSRVESREHVVTKSIAAMNQGKLLAQNEYRLAQILPIFDIVERAWHELKDVFDETTDMVIVEATGVSDKPPLVLWENYSKEVGIDSRFVGGFSFIYDEVPSPSERPEGVLPWFWNLALREAFAADLALLNIREFFGLPITFYSDMAKQAWDEAIHARFFLTQTDALLEEFGPFIFPEGSTRDQVETYLRTGSGLPVPFEGNMGGIFYNAFLSERLVLMQIDTEGPGFGFFNEFTKLDFCKSRDAILQGFYSAMNDEIFHTKLGHKWLRFIERENFSSVMEATRERRGLLFVAAACSANGKTLAQALQDFV